VVNDILKFLVDFFFHIITELPCIEIGTMTVRAGFKFDEEGFLLKYMAHFDLALRTRDIEDFVKPGTNEIIADID
jgi:hypothetical protein